MAQELGLTRSWYLTVSGCGRPIPVSAVHLRRCRPELRDRSHTVHPSPTRRSRFLHPAYPYLH